MKFISTRGNADALGFSKAVMEGLAPDGGLYIPESTPDISKKLNQWKDLSYQDLCYEFFSIFATDIPKENLKKIVHKSYEKFSDSSIAPLTSLNPKLYLLELYHGPTLAFKDFALQFLGNLYEYLLSQKDDFINVLGATSGDTGSAAINGLLDKKNVNIFILYPEGRVSLLQERQMTCTGAKNVFPIAIRGTFDDAQSIVKDIFNDYNFKKQFHLSAVNSINIARILAQCVYYIYAYLKLPKSARRNNLTFSVPTGNFGNVLSGWMVKQMGLPINTFHVSTNKNDILYRLFTSGNYAVRKTVKLSHAPSMDIQIASNFERFIYYLKDRNGNSVSKIMSEFKETGKLCFDDFNADGFSASKMNDSEILKKIKEIYEKYKIIIDPHTACAFKGLSDEDTTVVVATADPAKFPDTIEKAIGIHPDSQILSGLLEMRIKKEMMDADKNRIKSYIKRNSLSR